MIPGTLLTDVVSCPTRCDHLHVSFSIRYYGPSLPLTLEMRSAALGRPLGRSLTTFCDAGNSPFPATSPLTPNPPTACPSVISRGPIWCPPCFLLVLWCSACVGSIVLRSGCLEGPDSWTRGFAANWTLPPSVPVVPVYGVRLTSYPPHRDSMRVWRSVVTLESAPRGPMMWHRVCLADGWV